jgi:hypothetical protein
MNVKYSKNIKIVLGILQNEVDGDVSSALERMTKDYSMTWVNCGINGQKLFETTSNDLQSELSEVYPIKGRKYEIKNIAEGKDVVMVELIESYPDPKTTKVYRTPLVLVLEMKSNKIQTGRHYVDPRLSMMYLSRKQVNTAYKKKRKLFLKIK